MLLITGMFSRTYKRIHVEAGGDGNSVAGKRVG